MIDLRITLAPDGGLRLILPQGRSLDVGATPSSLSYIQRILKYAASGQREAPGYIGEFPTQHIIEIWKREDAKRRTEAKREEFVAMGIDVEALDIQL